MAERPSVEKWRSVDNVDIVYNLSGPYGNRLKKGLGEICLQVPILLINSKLTPEKYGLKFVDNVDNLF